MHPRYGNFQETEKKNGTETHWEKKKEITQEGIICFLLSPLLPLQRSLQAQDSQNSCPKIARPFLPAREGPLEDANALCIPVCFAWLILRKSNENAFLVGVTRGSGTPFSWQPYNSVEADKSAAPALQVGLHSAELTGEKH
mgnify:CR=1 FL=1